ncbi:MAG TPA: copper resistance system multicopper oxidase [Terriglobales bacterium]|nr:copper resistance system multicopper oxidase [Terriglobales bacterium]
MISRRQLLKSAQALGVLAGLERLGPAYAQTSAPSGQPSELSGNIIDLTIAETPFRVDDKAGTAVTINGTVPGPLVRLREGEEVTFRVANHLKEVSSIHWHGLLLPPEMDGVPGVSFAGIPPESTFTYRFPLKQSGTYWFHSHSGNQEQEGVYGPMIIEPAAPDPVKYDREYVVVLSNWSFTSGRTMVADLKKQSGFFNYQRRTMLEFVSDVRRNGWKPTMDNYLLWSRMRMDPTDFADVTSHAFVHLINGLSPKSNWTALFRPGERVRLRFINAASMSIYDVRIPGLKMTVVQADGQDVQPVEVDEFRISAAETYDVIVQPADEQAYTILAETNDRSGYTRATLAPRPGMSAEVPARRPRPLRTMDDMGMNMAGKTMGGMESAPKGSAPMPSGHENMPGMPAPARQQQPATPEMPGMKMDGVGDQRRADIPGSTPVPHGPNTHGTANQTTPEATRSRLHEPGTGLGNDGRRVLVYTDLKALEPFYDTRKPERELEIHITGHMERFLWSFDGKKFSEAREPIPFRYGERLRWTFVNDTMMEHPLHLHGMWMHLENGAGDYLPRKHTINVKPAERISVAITADARGNWAFHCHLLLHMEAGMFRIVGVSGEDPKSSA